MPQVSVVISTYNRSSMLRASLASALAQRDVDIEVIAVDNGSTDDTYEVLSSWGNPRLRVLRNEESLGSVGGRNTGLRAAVGDWIALLDDDDVWAPDKLRMQLDAATEAGSRWAYAGCVHIDGADRILGGRPPLAPDRVMTILPYRFCLPGGMSNVIWKSGALDGDGLLDPMLPFPADWDVSLRLLRQGAPGMVATPLVGYRQHGSNMSRHPANFIEQLRGIERKHADLRSRGGIDWGAFWRFVASEELRTGSRSAALRAYGRSIRAGDAGSLMRAPAVALPAALQQWALHTFLSDRDWIDAARHWLVERPVVAGSQR